MEKNKVIIVAELVTKAGNNDIAVKPLTVNEISVTHLTPPIIWMELEKPLMKTVLKDGKI